MMIDATRYQAIDGGGVSSARGFKAAGVHAGFKKKSTGPDLALIMADGPVACAGVFTKNVFCAAPVILCREHLDGRSCGFAQAILMNSGNANASTGQPGVDLVRKVAEHTASLLGCAPKEVLAASTGVIGNRLPFDPFEENLGSIIAQASVDGGHDAACAIMTTDTHAKEHAVSYESTDPDFEGTTFTVGGMVKGSGMIMPDMATMLAALTTDAPLSPELALVALQEAVNVSFNKVTIDSDTSTNDSCFLMASGKAAGAHGSLPTFGQGSLAFEEFRGALKAVCVNLARQIAADGEGATRLVTVNVAGAADSADADAAARAVANSPLVKTAIFGHDANWGRITMALGKSGARFSPDDVSIRLMGMPVFAAGAPVPFDEAEALRRFEAPEVTIDVDLGAGNAATTLWTCDLTHEYITINGDYRT
ncbi:MAG: bifunctional glutamate N-acetyltransferase/amino-acid acetyltransferase ArgJ [Eggerthellaceae bacterium]|nr:bifunctional glutamate N-acetyltransferase/amino-acid acetyltransferase ArgJ [Eggerthellaceae bacterium]